MTEPNATLTLLNLLGAVALLLWGLTIVRTGVTRAFGARLRTLLGAAARSRVVGCATGAGAAAIVQSSTAVILLVASLGRRLPLSAMLGMALGADLGAAFAALVLAANLGALAPVAALLGFALHQAGQSKTARNAGRAVLGLALVLVALHLVADASTPIRQAESVRTLLAALADEPALAVLVAALLTWLCHSGLAVVLLLASLAGAGHLDGALGVALVLGVNLGAGLPALVATLPMGAEARRLALGNLLMRGVGVAVALPFAGPASQTLAGLGSDAGGQIALAHLAFNAALVAVWLPLAGPTARLLQRLVPERKPAADPAWDHRPRYLDRAALANPPVALANAQREALRMGDIVHRMLGSSILAFDGAGEEAETIIARVKAMDDAVDDLNEAIKFYLTELARSNLTPEERLRSMTVFSFITNLEHVGDIIDRNVMNLATRKRRARLAFSRQGHDELRSLHCRLVANLELAFNIFLAADDELAGQLVAEKRVFGREEREAMERHLLRLREGNSDSIETSAIHLDLLRDFKRVNSHIAAVAYSVLNRGECGFSPGEAAAGK